ncbi:YbaN family protein [Tissierella sp.]|uniref:YbaN family protein n=1 Tax=Tissierella sp. TaxID=41274 RepID=UPI002855B22A|nr:YbaN family protein [Tissierella sp.]MDR7855056.1 YbaN family protein [Tissierella sp.]
MKLYKLLFISLGVVFTGIGAIGVVIPVLPTTPFLILASMFFVKGSEKFDIWLKSTKLYKAYAEDFIKDRSMTLKRKVGLMMLSDFMLAFPLIILDSIYIKVFIISVVIFKYYYFIFRIKTKRT